MRDNATPPKISTALIKSLGGKPCQSLRLYCGRGGAKTACSAVSSSGAIVKAGTIPTTRQASTSSSAGKRIRNGGSRGVRETAVGGGPKNTSRMKRSEYATVNMLAAVTI